ncbi:MAG: hypothetical protein R3C61_03730 [Bacteroidia bacterium]
MESGKVKDKDELIPLIEAVLKDDNKDNDVITLRVDKKLCSKRLLSSWP